MFFNCKCQTMICVRSICHQDQGIRVP